MKLYNTLYILESSWKNYDANKKFKYFNRLLFDNKIDPRYKVKFEIFTSSFLLGECDPNQKTIILNKNKLPHEVLDVVLIHEMIHSFIEFNDNAPHGKNFEKERSRINKIYKYEIPISETLNAIDKILDDIGL